MNPGIAQVHVKRHKGQLMAIGYGQTPRGQKYVKDSSALNVKTTRDPNFKTVLATAVENILA